MKTRNALKKYYAAYGTTLLLAIVCISGVFYWLYHASRENLVNMWKVNAVQMARDVEYYLTCPMDAVSFASQHVEEMMRNGMTNEEIGEYLISETAVYASVVDSNSTGVYGYCRGEYLDGSGWIPEADYEPTERPWYVLAKAAGGEITFVKPYLNLQTFRMMMSVSRLLSDGESVISMDIFLDGVQDMAKEMGTSDQVDSALVMDRTGFVVTHSDAGEIGRDYRAEGSAFERELAERVLAGDEAAFTIRDEDGEKMVFSKRINNEWTSVLIVSGAKMLGPIQYIYACTALALVLVILALTALFLLMTRKHEETELLDREVRAAAEVYDAMYLLNLATDRMRPLRKTREIEACMAEKETDCRRLAACAPSRLAAEDFADVLSAFLDVSTLDERMRAVRSVSQEYLDRSRRWMRMRFVAVSRDEEGRLREVLWALESIDEDKRRQDHLKKLAETDELTKTGNRRSGETQIRQMLAEGTDGMLLLLDVDRFKSINDIYGHAVGDKVLVAVASALMASMRKSDVVFRLGGDEFAAFAPGLRSEQTGSHICDGLLEKITGIRVEELGKREIHVSIGVTFSSANREDTFEKIYRRADKGMYESKQRGGNCATLR